MSDSISTNNLPAVVVTHVQEVVKANACNATRCSGCVFKYGKIVGSRGPADSPFVIIGESPGTEELKKGIPFAGPSGKVLQAGLDQYHHEDYPEPYIINAFKCYPAKSKNPKQAKEQLQAATAACRSAVEQEILRYPRKAILALGNAALWSTTNQYKTGITKERGKVFPSSLAEKGIVASVHPAYLLRGGGSFRQFKADVALAIRLAQGGDPKPFEYPTWEILDTLPKIQAFVKKCQEHGGDIAGDIETSGFSHVDDHILMAGFTFDGKHVYVIYGQKTDIPKELNFIEAAGDMWKTAAKFTWHNGKFDIKFYHAVGQEEARVDDDSMLLSYALDETRGIHDLETVASDWLNSPNWKGVLDQYKKKNDSYDVIPKDVLTKYMVYDIANTYNLKQLLRPIVASDALSNRLYQEVLIPGSAYLADVEKAGMYIDKQRVSENIGKLQGEANELVKLFNQAISHVSPPINLNSPLQLGSVLFDADKLAIPAKVKGTAVEILETLDHPAVTILRKYRKVQKGLSTYVYPILDHYTQPSDPKKKPEFVSGILASDGRIHPSYLLHGTATGRLACRDPNLQNIPRDPALRGQFRAKPGHLILECDLNQAELRSLAILSGDPVLSAIYLDPNSTGLHEVVRAEIYGYAKNWDEQRIAMFKAKWYTDTIERVLEEQKMRAKNVNFGIIYGITSAGLSDQIEDTPAEAQRMLNAWAKKFPVAWDFIQQCRMAPIRGQDLVTVFGHKKRFGVVSPENLGAQQNEAANMPHQSTASTITLVAGTRLYKPLRKFNAKIINTVHDSMLIEVPAIRSVVEEVATLVEHEMEQVPRDWGLTKLPFKADSKVGERWGEMGKISKVDWDYYKALN